MTPHQIYVLLVLGTALALFVTELVPVGVTGIGIIASLGLLGVLTPAEAMHAFSSPAVVLVGSLYVVSASLIRTGVISTIEDRLVRLGLGSELKLLMVATVTAALVSTILNNTSVIVLMIPILLGASQRMGIPPSRLLLPVSYAAIFGGTMTLIGTSTNVLVADLASDVTEVGFLDFLPMGTGYATIGLLYLWFLGRRQLPSRATVSSITQGRTFEYVAELSVREGTGVAGMTIEQMARRVGNQIRILQHIRGEELLDLADPGQTIEPGDELVLRASPEAIVTMRRDLQLETLPGTDAGEGISLHRTTFAEVVITPASQMIGRTLANIGLHRQLGITALALQRRGSHLRKGIVDLPLRPGDVILVQGEPGRIDSLRGHHGFLLLVGVEEKAALRKRAPQAIGILAAFVLLACFSGIDLPLLAIAASVGVLACGCISLGRAVREVDWSVLGLLAGAVTLGAALERSGLAEIAGQWVVSITRDLGPAFVLSAVYLLTGTLTELVSNGGAAALCAPIALATAAELGVSPRPFVFAVAFGASASFCTPIGYQTNTLVFGPGGYRFSDFVRVGLPLQIVLWIYASFALPFFYPF